MKIILSIFVTFALATTLSAQCFNQAVGIRGGITSAIFYDKGTNELTTTRYMISSRSDGMRFTYIKYKQFYKMDELPDNFSFYYGFGAHIGYARWSEAVSNFEGYYWQSHTAPVTGVDGLIGISYDMQRMPISFTFDAKPYFDVWGKNIFTPKPFDVAFGLVYSF
jgi:hypothetical protein